MAPRAYWPRPIVRHDGKRAEVAWSAMELDDLEHGLRIGVSIQVIADFIQRDADEVRQKADELGILPDRKRLP